MPVYEYACDGCEHRFEHWQKISEAPLKKCPKCGKSKARRLISAAAFQFKGTGWYVTDYARKGANGKAATNGKPDGDKGGEGAAVKKEGGGGASQGSGGAGDSGAEGGGKGRAKGRAKAGAS